MLMDAGENYPDFCFGIDGVVRDGVAEVLEMYAYLMGWCRREWMSEE